MRTLEAKFVWEREESVAVNKHYKTETKLTKQKPEHLSSVIVRTDVDVRETNQQIEKWYKQSNRKWQIEGKCKEKCKINKWLNQKGTDKVYLIRCEEKERER